MLDGNHKRAWLVNPPLTRSISDGLPGLAGNLRFTDTNRTEREKCEKKVGP